MFKKALSLILSACLCCSLVVGVSAANTFSDVTNANYPWAVKEIEEMASRDIIKGYSNTVFAPADKVTKIQSLLLVSRIIGYSESDNEEYVEAAYAANEETLAIYSTPYKKEISYLLYKGVLEDEELPVYIGDDNADVPLKRYEAAAVMTKAMGADAAAAEAPSVVFSDSDDIPASAKPYVNYVYNTGLMLGVSSKTGENEFSPLTNVTRAQMAVMLYRMMQKMDETTEYGTVDNVNINTKTIMIKDEDGKTSGVSLPAKDDDIRYLTDGVLSSLEKITPQAKIAITRRGGEVRFIETISVIGDTEVEGAVNSITTSSKKTSIKLRDLDSDEIVEYIVADDVSVTNNGSPSTLQSVKTGMYAVLQLKNGKVITIDASAKDATVSGTVKDIVLTPEVKLTLETSSGKTADYIFDSEATATRNGSKADISDILIGDKVTLTLLYNRIFKVSAQSKSYTKTGTIESILIATSPQITLKQSDGTSETFSVARDASFKTDGNDATIYDLRLGSNITLKIEGETVVSAESVAPIVSSVLTGTVETVNSAYGFMLLNVVNAQTGDVTQTQIFLKKTGLKIIDSTSGKEVSLTSLKSGMSVSVTGVMNTGAFEATTVIILP